MGLQRISIGQDELHYHRQGTRLTAMSRLFLSGFKFVAASAILFILTYLFGHGILEGNLGGNDTSWALSLANWYNDWFPRIPIWYPLQGAGTPITVLHPPGASLSVVILHRLTNFTLIQSFRTIGFLSVALTTVGLFSFVWWALKSWSAGLLSGFFYLLSSGSWDWLVNVGLYTQAVSVMFVPWTLLFFDTYLRPLLDGKESQPPLIQRLALLFGATLLGLSFTYHAATGVSLVMAISLYVIVYPVVLRDRTHILARLRGSISKGATFVISGVAMGAFLLVPLAIGNGLSNREGLSYVAAHSVSSYDVLATLGITAPPDPSYIMTFALPVILFAVIGLAVGIFRRSLPLVWAVVAIFFLLFVYMPILSPGVVEIFEFLWSRLLDRPIMMALVLVPAVAAYGSLSIARMISSIPDIALSLFANRGKSSNVSKAYRRIAKPIIVSMATLIIGLALVSIYEKGEWERVGYGPPDLLGKLPVAFDGKTLWVENTPEFAISRAGVAGYDSLFDNISRSVSLSKMDRVDVSPNLGGVTQNLSLHTEASIVNIYSYQTSIIHAMWGYQQGLFYGSTAASSNELNELAKWFGISDVFLHRDLDDLTKYDLDEWPISYPAESDTESFLEVRSFVDARPMATVNKSRSVLVVGGYENGSYEQVFRNLVEAGLGVDEILIVEGEHFIDSYSLDEFKLFDVVLLHGYGYKDRDKAWRTLSQYVSAGGSLYVDTGWQYWTPDWEMESTPDVLPIENLVWTDYGRSDEYVLHDQSWSQMVDPSDFNALDWDGRAWNVSSSNGNMRPWGEPVLSVDGNPLVIRGSFGKGRVVWSGMNLIGHALSFDNAAERKFLGLLLEWLAPLAPSVEQPVTKVERINPDQIRITLSGPLDGSSSLIWREAYSPDWQARVEDDGQSFEVPIYRAGPGMMLLRLPSVEGQQPIVVLDYRLGWKGWSGFGVSALTTMALASAVIWPSLPQNLWGRFRRRRSQRSPKDLWDRPEQAKEPRPILQPTLGIGDEEASKLLAKTQASHLGSDELLWRVDDDIADPMEVQQLWADLVDQGKVIGPEDDRADQIINWWRSSRFIEKDSDPSSEE